MDSLFRHQTLRPYRTGVMFHMNWLVHFQCVNIYPWVLKNETSKYGEKASLGKNPIFLHHLHQSSTESFSFFCNFALPSLQWCISHLDWLFCDISPQNNMHEWTEIGFSRMLNDTLSFFLIVRVYSGSPDAYWHNVQRAHSPCSCHSYSLCAADELLVFCSPAPIFLLRMCFLRYITPTPYFRADLVIWLYFLFSLLCFLFSSLGRPFGLISVTADFINQPVCC